MARCDGDVGGKWGMAFQRCFKDPKLFPRCSYRIVSVLPIGNLWLCIFLKFRTSFYIHCVDCSCDRRIVSDVVKYLSPCSYAEYNIIKVPNALSRHSRPTSSRSRFDMNIETDFKGAGCKLGTWYVEVQMFKNKIFSMNLWRKAL
jgi:hypothetical protein